MGFRFTGRDGSRRAAPFATPLLLLALFGHAFVVGATHFHRVRAEGASLAAGVGERGDAGQSPASGAHAECLLCRLQRNYVSDLQHTTPAVAAPASQPRGHSDQRAASASAAHFLAPSGRAPPHA